MLQRLVVYGKYAPQEESFHLRHVAQWKYPQNGTSDRLPGSQVNRSWPPPSLNQLGLDAFPSQVPHFHCDGSFSMERKY